MSTERPATVAEALAAARALGVERLDAQWLLAHHLGRARSWLLAHDTDALPVEVACAFRADLHRRADGVPLAYLTGRREFHGLTLHVGPDVLDPQALAASPAFRLIYRQDRVWVFEIVSS